MAEKRLRQRRLNLNEIYEELQIEDTDVSLPDFITILPPENYDGDVTDEDSGEEDNVLVSNLPGAQLRVAAELVYRNDTPEQIDYDSDDEPLSKLSKKSCTDYASHQPSTSSAQNMSTPESVSAKTITIPKNKVYNWIPRDNRPNFSSWHEKPMSNYSPFEYFQFFFDDEVINLLVTYSNTYASQKNKQGNITSDEIRCFLGVLLLSGYVIVPRRFMYWENSPDCGVPLIYNAISRDRFTFIMTHLHCCDNNQLDHQDKFTKLRPLIDLLNQKFASMAPFEEHHSIDEAIVPYYGGHPCKQFIRGKPIRWGYKLWVGATRLGYIIWFEPYQGQSEIVGDDYKSLGLGARVILQYSDILRNIDMQAPFHTSE